MGTDAADGNPLTTRIPIRGLESTKRFPQFPQGPTAVPQHQPNSTAEKGDTFNEVRMGTFSKSFDKRADFT